MRRAKPPLTALAGILMPLLVGCGSVDESAGLRGSGGLLVSVNELQASNHNTLSDGIVTAGNAAGYDDWIELCNAGQHDAHLEGYFITDNPEQPFKQMLPTEAVVPAGGFLLLWADNEPAQGPLHLAFGLSKDGESVYLSDPNGNLLDGIDYGAPTVTCAQCDYSYARFPDGSGAFAWCDKPTPARANGSACAASP